MIRFLLKIKQQSQTAFYLAVVGIAAILFGLGFIMQFLFLSKLLVFNVLLPFVGSLALLVAGHTFRKYRKNYRIGNILYAISTFLIFASIYFLDGLRIYNVFWSNWIIYFIGILLATGLGIYLVFKTKDILIASVTYICSSLTPFYLGVPQPFIVHFIYLFIITYLFLRFCYGYSWKLLIAIIFTIVHFTIGYLLIFVNTNLTYSFYISIIHLFVYLFYIFIFFEGIKLRKDFISWDYIFMVSNILLLIVQLYYLQQIFSENFNFGRLIAYNTVFFVFLFPAFKSQKNDVLQQVIFFIVCILLSISVPFYIPKNYLGVFIACETCLVLYYAFSFNSLWYRIAAYILLLISFVAIFPTFITIAEQWKTNIFSDGYINLIFTGLYFVLIGKILSNNESELLELEYQTKNLVAELFSLWLLVFSAVSFWFFTTEWLSMLMILPSFLLIRRSYNQQLIFTKIIGYTSYVIIILSELFFIINKLNFNEAIDFYTISFIDLLKIGIIIYSFKILYLNVKQTEERKLKKENTKRLWLINILDIAMIIWFGFLSVYSIGYATKDWLSVFSFVYSLFLIYRGLRLKNKIVQYCGISVFVMAFILASIVAYLEIRANFEINLFTTGYYNLAAIGVAIFGFIFLNKKFQMQIPRISDNLNTILWNIFYVWFVVTFFISTYYYLHNFAFTLLIPLMFLLIYISDLQKLKFMENFAIFLIFVIAFEILRSLNYSELMRIFRQPPHVLILIGEMYLFAWALKLFYGTVLHQQSQFADYLRQAATLLLPVLFLPVMFKLQRENFPIILWVSVSFCYFLYRYLKSQMMLIELYILVLAASAAVCISQKYSFYIYSYTILTTILFLQSKRETVGFQLLYWFSFFYTIILSVLFYISSFGDMAGALLFPVSYLLIALYRNFDFPHSSKLVYPIFRFSMFALLIVCGFLIFELIEELTRSSRYVLLRMIFFYISVVIINFLLFFSKKILIYEKSTVLNEMYYVVCQVFNFIAYFILLNFIFDANWNPLLTLFTVAHGLTLIFMTRTNNYNSVRWLPYIMFIFAFIKLFIHDLIDFNLLEKVVFFVAIGVLFLGGSIVYFIKLKKN